ncbi:MAG TPA: CARDB domain-containing protein, partial [Anaerolineae bacterium]
PIGLSTLGTYWTSYVAAIAGTANLRALQVIGSAPYNPRGGPVTAQVTFVFSNSGDINLTQPFVVSVYDGANNQLLYTTTVNGLPGCGRTAAVRFAWPNLNPGYHPLLAVLDPQGQIAEATKSDNQVSGGVLVGTNWNFLPFLGH